VIFLLMSCHAMRHEAMRHFCVQRDNAGQVANSHTCSLLSTGALFVGEDVAACVHALWTVLLTCSASPTPQVRCEHTSLVSLWGGMHALGPRTVCVEHHLAHTHRHASVIAWSG
jgi:hypothetical protein